MWMISTKLSTELFHCFSGVFPLLHIPTTLLRFLRKIILYIPYPRATRCEQLRKEVINNYEAQISERWYCQRHQYCYEGRSSKTTMSILECILIDASSGEIKLTGNDMELGIETTVNGEILEHGKIALDAKLFPKLPDVYPARMQWLPLNLTINSTQPSAAKILYSISRVVMEMNFPTFLILKK